MAFKMKGFSGFKKTDEPKDNWKKNIAPVDNSGTDRWYKFKKGFNGAFGVRPTEEEEKFQASREKWRKDNRIKKEGKTSVQGLDGEGESRQK